MDRQLKQQAFNFDDSDSDDFNFSKNDESHEEPHKVPDYREFASSDGGRDSDHGQANQNDY